MAAGTWNVLLHAKLEIMQGNVNFSSNIFRMGLWRAGANLSATLDVSTVASITSQLPSARGYGQTGREMSNESLSPAATTTVAWTTDGVCWSANGGVLGSGGTSIQFAVIWESGAAKSGTPIAYVTLSSSDFTVPDASKLLINGGAGAAAAILTLT